jgi:3-deoxy-D-manno-octulosonate 8-phosphate phosphatase (KDO 8-P phosphatase)
MEGLKEIRLLVMDVDGTLTDGAMYYGPDGEVMKRFMTRDGMGITLLHKAGIMTAIITSEDTPIVRARAQKLKIEHVRMGVHDKSTALRSMASDLAIPLEHIAYIGDDVNDLHVMKICGVSACPSDAVEAIRNTANIICTSVGGNGAVREFAEAILRAQNKPITLEEQW